MKNDYLKERNKINKKILGAQVQGTPHNGVIFFQNESKSL